MIPRVERDKEVFRIIFDFMVETGGEAPKIQDILNRSKVFSSPGTASRGIEALEKMGLLGTRKTVGSDIRSAGSIRIKGAIYKPSISINEAYQKIEEYYNNDRGPAE